MKIIISTIAVVFGLLLISTAFSSNLKATKENKDKYNPFTTSAHSSSSSSSQSFHSESHSESHSSSSSSSSSISSSSSSSGISSSNGGGVHHGGGNGKGGGKHMNCVYDEEETLEVVKRVIDSALNKPGNAQSKETADWAKAKSSCMSALDTQRKKFHKSLEAFSKALCQSCGTGFRTDILENTVWAKMSEIVVSTGSKQTKQCSSVLSLKKGLDIDSQNKINAFVNEKFCGFTNTNPANLQKFIAGAVATRRVGDTISGDTFTRLNEVSRSG